MSFSYDKYDRRQQTSNRRLGYWVPLLVTATIATAGVAAWIWSERQENDSDEDADLSYGEDGFATKTFGPEPTARGEDRDEDDSLLSRVIRRTPSPQILFDAVSKKTAAGFAAAGAAAGAALASIREEDKDAYADHNRWTEEADSRRVEARSGESQAAVHSQTKSFVASLQGGPSLQMKKRTVVIVVSAESMMDIPHEEDASYRSENLTILSHLPDTDFTKTRLFVLIYAPSLRSRPNSRTGGPSLGSSYSAISTPAQTPGDELQSIDSTVFTPALSARSSDSHLYTTLQTQALRLVDNPAMVMPFTSPTGYVHMLRHLSPDLVYIVDALSGTAGKNISDLSRWVKQTIVVVGGDGNGLGGLVDTDDESAVGGGGGSKDQSEHAGRGDRWWESTDLVGLGKGVEVVDASRLMEDYERRVGRKD